MMLWCKKLNRQTIDIQKNLLYYKKSSTHPMSVGFIFHARVIILIFLLKFCKISWINGNIIISIPHLPCQNILAFCRC